MINKSVKSKEAKKDNKSSPKSGRMIGSVQNYRDLKSHKSTKIVCCPQISHIFIVQPQYKYFQQKYA